MAFNYKWFKSTATVLPNQRVFNRYFKSGKYERDYKIFSGLEFTKRLGDYVRDNLGGDEFFYQRERYYPVFSVTGNVFVLLITFLPILIGGTASLICALLAPLAMFSTETDYPWILLGVTVGWNLFFLNFNFMFNFIFSRFKGAYIDRQHQTLSFTWRVKGDPPKNEFGHATFPLADIEAFSSLQLNNQYGGSTYTLCLAHKDHNTYRGAFLQTGVKANGRNKHFCYLEWELLQRFADNGLPLPDMPDLEQYRHLDPLTAAYDKKHNRPEYHWRKMHMKQKIAIETAIEEEADGFGFEWAIEKPKKYAQKELEKPWLTWPINQQYFKDEAAVPEWKKRLKILFTQLTIGMS